MRQWFTGLMALIMLASMLPVAALAESAAPPEEPEPTAQAETDGLPAPEDSADGDAAPETTQDPQEDAAPSPSPETEEDAEATPAPEAEQDPEATPTPEAVPAADPARDAPEIDAVLPADEPMPIANNGSVNGFDWTLDDYGTLTLTGSGKLDLAGTTPGTEIPLGITSVIVNGASSIGDGCFEGWSQLESVTLADTVTSIGDSAFSGCGNLSHLRGCGGLEAIGDNAFYGCEMLPLVGLPTHVTTIGNGAFNGCDSLALTELPVTVRSIGTLAFANCDGLTHLTLPKGLGSMGSYVFDGSNNLTSLTFLGRSAPTIDENTFGNADALRDIFIPEGAGGYNVSPWPVDKIKVGHTVTVDSVSGGSASAAPDYAGKGDTIVLTASPDEGYHLKEWQIEPPVDVTGNSFTMPDQDVTVTPVFEAHIFGKGWEKDSVSHWRQCACGARSGEDAHDFDGAGVCQICGYITFAAPGKGTSDDPYQIADKAQLEAFRTYVNGGNDCRGEYFQLTADIDLSGENWTPIGTSDYEFGFGGTFDGGGHTIRGLYVNVSEGDAGLFGYQTGVIQNLGVTGTVTNAGPGMAGGIVGNATIGTVTGCHNACAVSGSSYVGGITGYCTGTISNCENTGVITNTVKDTASGTVFTGGIVGHGGDVTISGCHNAGAVSGGNNTGGIVGDSISSTIENCYNTAAISGHSNVGGIAGSSYMDTVIDCYNTGTVTGDSAVGGIAGFGYVTKLENCYNSGKVSGSSDVGAVEGNGSNTTVTNCYYLTGTAAGGVGDGATTGKPVEKSASEFRSLADTLGGAWEDDFLLGRPVLKSNREAASVSYTEDHPYEIPDKETLKALRDYVNAGHDCAGMYFKLTADIDLTGEDWTPIGTDLDHPFNGTFDGGGHTVSGMSITGESLGGDVGFFGCTGKSATVKDLKVAGEIHGKNGTSDGGDVGGIVGRSDGAIENCENAVVIHVTGYASIGGIVGNSSGSVSGCVNRGSVTGDGYTGGIAGYGLGTIENCKNTASIESDKYAAGGIAGNGNSNVSGCINTGPVTGGGSAGGIWGSGGAIVQNCGNSGTVTARGSGKAGGIFGSFFGHSSGTVYYAAENCCNTGSVTAEASGSAGGICGSDCEIKNSYYLDTCGAAGQGTAKTNWDFASGQVAYLLQAGQAAQVWGQSLGGDAPDTYPVLSGDGTKRICQVTFLTDLDRDYRALLYFNPNSAVGRLPEMPRIPGYVPVKWALTDSPDGEPFTAETVVTGDMTVYAIYEKCGDLTVSVANAGEGADPDREWRFRVEIDDPYYDGNGELTFTDGAAEFTLRAGESRTVPDLRPGTKYTVTELNADQDGYTAAATDAAGVIVSGETAAAAFTNTYGSAAPGPEESKDPDDTPTDSKSDGPKTGDESHMTYWLGLLCLSLTGMAAATLALVLDRKRPAPGRHVRR